MMHTTTTSVFRACDGGCGVRHDGASRAVRLPSGGLFPTQLGGATALDARGLARERLGVPLKVFLLVTVIVLACAYPGLAAEGQASFGELRDLLRRDDLAGLAALLTRPGVLEARDGAGDTPLILAAQIGSPAAVRRILEAGAEVNATNAAGATALLRGAASPEVVGMLLDHGARPDLASAIGHTPLMLAARSPGATESVRRLLARGAEVKASSRYGATALMAAVAASNSEVVRWLVDRGADVNAVPMRDLPGVDAIWGGLRTPLMWAAFRGDRELADYLIDRGATVNQVIPFGTALTHAAWRGDEAVARLLVARGAEVRTAEPFSGYTALHWAASAETGGAGLVGYLLARGADPLAEGGHPVDAFVGEAQTAWKLAHQRGETDVARLLSRGGARIGAVPDAGAAVVSAAAVDRLSVASALALAVPALQRTAEISRESFVRHASKQNCVSCHQQYFPLAAVSAGRTRGVPVDEDSLTRLTGMVLEAHRKVAVETEPLFHPDGPHDFGYAMLALRTAGVGASEVTDDLVHHLAAIQQRDGRWNVNLPRPPMQSSDITATALALHALKHFGWPARASEFEGRVARARAWLEQAMPETHEERVYQVLGLAWAGVSREALTHRLERLMSEQRENGGWAQLPGLDADAYATGQALYAMCEVGGFGGEHPACVRAARFLLGTQGADGTWHVTRRAFPFQPTMESGFPHGRDGWISATGTGWAVLGLSRMISPLSGDEGRSLAVRRGEVTAEVGARERSGEVPRPGVEAFEASVEFVRDIQPVLERSCVPCHSGERARGQFRVTDRVALVSAGSQGVPSVIPGRGGESPLLKYVADAGSEWAMPPLAKRGAYPGLDARELALLRRWVDLGAPWPDGVTLGSVRTVSVAR